jgi:hypothetical protein
MSEAPRTIEEILRKLTDVLRADIFSENPQPPPPGEVVTLYNDDAYWTILPSFFYWLPRGRRAATQEALRQIREETNLFPHIGVTGRSRWADFAIGGAMIQYIDFRIFIIVAAPPAVDVVERINNTLAWFSMIILNRHNVPPYWWFTEVREIEPLFRTQIFPQWTFGYLGGTLRCHPQVLPFLWEQVAPRP